MLTPTRLASLPMPIVSIVEISMARILKYGPYSRVKRRCRGRSPTRIGSLRMAAGAGARRIRSASDGEFTHEHGFGAAAARGKSLAVVHLARGRGGAHLSGHRTSAASVWLDPLPDHSCVPLDALFHASQAQAPLRGNRPRGSGRLPGQGRSALHKSRSLLRSRDSHARVTFVELFFDLVFVFAVTQLSHTLVVHLTLIGALQTLFLLLAVWWVWMYTCWFTNWVDPDRPPVRALMFTLMLAGLLMSAAI